MNKKNVSIIGSVGIPANYGGFETLTEYLAEYLNESYDITVYCSKKAYKTYPKVYKGVKLEYINLSANGAHSIIYDIISLIKAVRKSDVILILGVSGCIILPFLKLLTSKKIITNIDGLEWKRDKWNKIIKRFLKFSESLAVKYSDVVIGDNQVIISYIKIEYEKDATLIAYGADHVNALELSNKLLTDYPFLGNKYAFKVCRIEPENNIDMILSAFKNLDTMELVIVGNWDNSEYGTNLRKVYNKYKHIHLMDPIYDQDILNQFRSNCYLYLHGHSAGGTNPSLVEAMYLKLPVITYNALYNIETTRNEALYFGSSDELNSILQNLDEVSLNKVSDKMAEIAQERYTWKNISLQYSNTFDN